MNSIKVSNIKFAIKYEDRDEYKIKTQNIVGNFYIYLDPRYIIRVIFHPSGNLSEATILFKCLFQLKNDLTELYEVTAEFFFEDFLNGKLVFKNGLFHINEDTHFGKLADTYNAPYQLSNDNKVDFIKEANKYNTYLSKDQKQIVQLKLQALEKYEKILKFKEMKEKNCMANFYLPSLISFIEKNIDFFSYKNRNTNVYLDMFNQFPYPYIIFKGQKLHCFRNNGLFFIVDINKQENSKNFIDKIKCFKIDKKNNIEVVFKDKNIKQQTIVIDGVFVLKEKEYITYNSIGFDDCIVIEIKNNKVTFVKNKYQYIDMDSDRYKTFFKMFFVKLRHKEYKMTDIEVYRKILDKDIKDLYGYKVDEYKFVDNNDNIIFIPIENFIIKSAKFLLQNGFSFDVIFTTSYKDKNTISKDYSYVLKKDNHIISQNDGIWQEDHVFLYMVKKASEFLLDLRI